MISDASTTSPLLRSGESFISRAQNQPTGKAYPAWYTPGRLLGLFCWVTFLVYLDRGLLASNGVNDGISVSLG